MRLNRVVTLLFAVSFAATSGCGLPACERSSSTLTHDATSTPTAVTSTTTAITAVPSTTAVGSSSTTAPALRAVGPSYLVYGWEGVRRVHGESSTQLIVEPVRWAAADGASGIVFETMADEPGSVWLPADGEHPREIETSDRTGLAHRLVFLHEGRPSLLVSRSWDHMERCELGDYLEELTILELATGDERFLMCHDSGPDGGESFTSYGGGLFSTVGWIAVGAGHTNSFLRFYDLDGEEVAAAHNPFPESCAPCKLSAMLSEDGALLAFAHWPTAFWPPPQPPIEDYSGAYREWYAEQQDIPTEIVVLEMASGDEVFATEVAGDARVTEFDGRFVVVTGADGRTAFDISTGDAWHLPPATTEPAAFWTGILASFDQGETSYDAAQRVASELSAAHDVSTGVLWSDGFPTLNPGYWAVFTGHVPKRLDAIDHCAAIDAACYPRYVATADVIDAQIGRSMLVLEPDGLGLVAFGDPENEVLAMFERVLGSPPTDTWQLGPALDVVGWVDFGLYLGFSRSGYEDYDFPRLVGWRYIGGSLALPLRTAAGVGIGHTIAELREIYGNDLVVPGYTDETGGVAVHLLDGDDGIVAIIRHDIGVVAGLLAGAQPGV